MKPAIYLFVLLLLSLGKFDSDLRYSSTYSSQNLLLDEAPEFYVLDWKEGAQLTSQETEFFIEIDSMGRQEVIALVNERKEPVLYTAEIATPVCADGKCKLMNIKFYWTLLGEYAGFDRYPMMPLTKFDHDEFLQEDYQKLHELLLDDKSLLGRRRIDQLVEKPKMRTVNGVDAISGATITRVKESVVYGALYSCYTAWHLVHGDIQEKLMANTLSVSNEKMIVDMLYSRNQEYQIFALENIVEAKLQEHFLQLAEVFKTSTPLVRSIIVKLLTTKFKDTPVLQKPFWEAFDKVDLGSRSLLVKFLEEAPEYVPALLSTKLKAMSKNQMKSYLTHLSELGNIDAEIQNNLKEFSISKRETYAYLVKEFVEETQ